MRILRRTRRPSGAIEAAEAAIRKAQHGTEQAAEARAQAETKLQSERSFFRRLLADDRKTDTVAEAIAASLMRGGRA